MKLKTILLVISLGVAFGILQYSGVKLSNAMEEANRMEILKESDIIRLNSFFTLK